MFQEMLFHSSFSIFQLYHRKLMKGDKLDQIITQEYLDHNTQTELILDDIKSNQLFLIEVYRRNLRRLIYQREQLHVENSSKALLNHSSLGKRTKLGFRPNFY